MRFLLKFVNPALAVFVLLLCIWAASMDNGKLNWFGIADGAFGTYFFAKGVFCAATLMIAGRSLLARLEVDPTSFAAYSAKDFALVGVILAALVGAVVGIHAKHPGSGKVDPDSVTETIVSPKAVTMKPLEKVGAAEHLTFSTQISNGPGEQWTSINVSAEVFIGGIYSGELSASDTGFKPNEKRNVLLKSTDLLTKEIRDSITFKVAISGTRCRDCGGSR